MNLLQRLLSLRREQPEKRFSFNDYLSQLNTLTFGGISYPSLQQTLVGGDLEEVQEATTPFFREAFKTNGPVFACTLLRLAVFSQGRFVWQRMRDGRPDELFGNRDLGILETPWRGGTLQQMLAQMEVDVVTAGNSFWGVVDGSFVYLRPEWVRIVLAHKMRNGQPVGLEKVGFIYYHEGREDAGTLFTLDEIVHYCVDEETEILTADGWKNLDELQIGDETLTLNHKTGLTEWQPVTDVCIFPAQSRELVSMEGKEHSSLTTTNHRWAVERKNSRAGTYVRRWTTSETIGTGDRVPLAGHHADLPLQPKYSDALVELVAWFWTEGSIARRSDGSHSRAISISQSESVNGECVARIRAALRAVFGKPQADRTASHDTPRWHEDAKRSNGTIVFRLSSAASDIVTEHAPGKVVTTSFLRSLTASQLDLFIKISLLADNAGPARLAQKSKAAAEQFALACMLAGHGVSIRQKPNDGMWSVRIRKDRHVYPQEDPRGAFRIRRVRNDGRVWCPRTPNQTWLARRKGSVYFTGNSPHPDPVANFRGMSWLRPVIDDTQGDKAMERHKQAFLANGATPNMIVRLDPDFVENVAEFREFHDEFKKTYEGADNAYKTLFLAGAADAKVVGADFSQMTFTSVQGRTETRIAMAAGTHPVLIGMSEGMQGSSLNEGNFNSARRAFVDRTLRFLWEAAAGSFQQIFDVPAGARLWYDARDVAFLREDRRDLAQIQSLQAQLMATLVRDGWNPDAVIRAVEAEDWTVLLGQHSGNLSVQLQPADPDQQNNSNGNGNGDGDGEAERLARQLLAYDKTLLAGSGEE